MTLPLAEGKYRNPARVLGSLLCFTGLTIWLFHFCVWYQYDGTRPTKAIESAGRIFPQNTHGHVVYLTKEESARLTHLTVLAFGLMGSGFLVRGLFVEGFHWRKAPAPWEKKQW